GICSQLHATFEGFGTTVTKVYFLLTPAEFNKTLSEFDIRWINSDVVPRVYQGVELVPHSSEYLRVSMTHIGDGDATCEVEKLSPLRSSYPSPLSALYHEISVTARRWRE